MKKLFTLIAAALVALGANADQTVFSLSVKSGLSITAHVEAAASTTVDLADYATFSTGASASFENITTGAKRMIGYNQGASGAKQNWFCLPSSVSTTNGTQIKATFTTAIAAGDVISYDILGSASAADDKLVGLQFNTTAAKTGAVGPTGENHTTVEKISQSYTVKEGDAIVGATTIYIFRNGGITQYFDNLTIIRPGEKTAWDKPTFTKGDWNAQDQKWAVTISSETGSTLKYTVGTEAEVTASGTSVVVYAAPGTVISATATGGSYSDATDTYTVPDVPVVDTPKFSIGAYNYEKAGYPITVTCTTEGAELTYKLTDSGTYAPVDGVVYVPGETLFTVNAQKTGYTLSSNEVTVNKAPSATSPEVLIPVVMDDNYVKDFAQTFRSVSFVKTCVGGVNGGADKETFPDAFKLRTNQQGDGATTNTFALKVNEGFKVKKVEIKGYSNNTAETAKVKITGISVDGTPQNFTAVEFPTITETQTYETVTTGDIAAENSIVFTFDNSNITTTSGAKNNQIIAQITVTYDNGTTAINTVSAASAQANNGVVKTANYIMKDGKKYNFAGQQMK